MEQISSELSGKIHYHTISVGQESGHGLACAPDLRSLKGLQSHCQLSLRPYLKASLVKDSLPSSLTRFLAEFSSFQVVIVLRASVPH